jgi:DNA-binding XRE family transcriptional regulator
MSPDTLDTETTPQGDPAPPPAETAPKRFRNARARTTRTPLKSLKGWRLRHNLDQREAARILGVSQSTFARMEALKRYPRPSLAKKMKVITGLSIEVIMGIDR